MAKVAKATTLIELMGIRMAAINGESVPCTAKEIPTTLYRKEIIKLILTTTIEVEVKLMKSKSLLNFEDSIIPSQAGEKL